MSDKEVVAKRKKPDDDVIEIIDLDDGNEVSATPLSNFKCPICLDTPEVLVATECGHLYCDNCVFQALRHTRNSTKSSGQCSICRKTVKYSNVRYLEMRIAGEGDIKRPKPPRAKKKAKPKGSPEVSDPICATSEIPLDSKSEKNLEDLAKDLQNDLKET